MTLRHWKLDRDGEGFAWLTIDRKGASTNSLSAEVLEELRSALSDLAATPPKGLIIRSGKDNGFIAGAPAALDMLLTGKTIDARRAKKLGVADECVPTRIMMNTARGVLLAAPSPRRLPFPLSLTSNPLLRPIIAAQARKQVAARARREHYPAPYAILDIWVKHDGDALAPPPSDPASIAHLIQTPTATVSPGSPSTGRALRRIRSLPKSSKSCVRS